MLRTQSCKCNLKHAVGNLQINFLEVFQRMCFINFSKSAAVSGVADLATFLEDAMMVDLDMDVS